MKIITIHVGAFTFWLAIQMIHCINEWKEWKELNLPQTLEAMEEARRISRDPDVKGYTSMEELKQALDD